MNANLQTSGTGSFAQSLAVDALATASAQLEKSKAAAESRTQAIESRFEELATLVRSEGEAFIRSISPAQWNSIRSSITAAMKNELNQGNGVESPPNQRQKQNSFEVVGLATYVSGGFGGIEEYSFAGRISVELKKAMNEFLAATNKDYLPRFAGAYRDGVTKELTNLGFPVTVISKSDVITPGSDGACDTVSVYQSIGIDVQELMAVASEKR